MLFSALIASTLLLSTTSTTGSAPPPAHRTELPLAAPVCDQIVDLSGECIDALCSAQPWGRAPGCDLEPDVGQCIDIIGDLRHCKVSECEYAACAEALRVAPCGVRPAECKPISDCINALDQGPPDDFESGDYKCEPTEDMTDQQILEWCIENPWKESDTCLGDLGDPSVGACVDMFTWLDGCDASTCAYTQCLNAVMATPSCGGDLPVWACEGLEPTCP